MFLIILQGFPTATTFDGMFLVTTLPAPIDTLSPMVTPPIIFTPPPIQTLLPIVIGFAYSKPLFLSSGLMGCSAV